MACGRSRPTRPAPHSSIREAPAGARSEAAKALAAAVRRAVSSSPSKRAAGRPVAASCSTYSACTAGNPAAAFAGWTVTTLVPSQAASQAGLSRSVAPPGSACACRSGASAVPAAKAARRAATNAGKGSAAAVSAASRTLKARRFQQGPRRSATARRAGTPTPARGQADRRPRPGSPPLPRSSIPLRYSRLGCPAEAERAAAVGVRGRSARGPPRDPWRRKPRAAPPGRHRPAAAFRGAERVWRRTIRAASHRPSAARFAAQARSYSISAATSSRAASP